MRLSVPAPNGWRGLSFGATSSPYSESHPHRGQDWGWYYGRPVESKRVYSNCTGVVTAVHDGYGTGRDQNQGWGNGVEIQITRSVVSKLWHFNKGAIEVRVGQTVTPETFIGYMGRSGWTNGGTHLHEELWVDGVRVDPQTYRDHELPGTGYAAGIETSSEDEEMTPEDRELLVEVRDGILWLKDRVGGSVANPNGSVSDMLLWLKTRIGGSTKSAPTITDQLRSLRGK